MKTRRFTNVLDDIERIPQTAASMKTKLEELEDKELVELARKRLETEGDIIVVDIEKI
jgi:hypothetical protein